MDKRELLQAEARGYGKGYAHALEVAQAEKDTRHYEIFEEERRYQREHTRRVEWGKTLHLPGSGQRHRMPDYIGRRNRLSNL